MTQELSTKLVPISVLYFVLVLFGVSKAVEVPLLSSALVGVGSLFEYETSELLQDKDDGIIAAFGDFNGDQFVDIFVITNDSQAIDLLLAQENKPYTRSSLINVSDVVITSVIPADFNGDTLMDVMLTTRAVTNKTGPYKVIVYWGNNSSRTLSPPLTLAGDFIDEPLVFDYNADMYPDLLAEIEPGIRKVWVSHPDSSFTMTDFSQSSHHNTTPFVTPQSHAFVDVNADFCADLVLTTQTGYELWLNIDGVFVLNVTYSYPELFKDGYIGQSSFADLDQDKVTDHIVAGCLDKDCTQSAVVIRYNDQWLQLLTLSDPGWNFFPPEVNKYAAYTNQSFPAVLRIADYNLDGYPDAIAVLKNTSGTGNQQVFVLDNIPCEGESCDVFSRSFILQHVDVGKVHDDAMVAAFYDIYEDGTPDVVMVTMSHDPIKESYNPHIVLLKNDIAMHSCFIKVSVISGLCYKNCPSQSSLHGVNYPGAVVSYKTRKTDGTTQQSIGTQLSQMSHYSLQTPYQTFGLGEMPNIIDHLVVSIPHPANEQKRQRSWPFIIPNSQLTVIPHPPSKPSSWMLKLYVTPSQLVYFTGAALLGTCGFVAGIVGILHWREKREDRLEKKQDSQRFHFDAM